jgi:hypothetical protein
LPRVISRRIVAARQVQNLLPELRAGGRIAGTVRQRPADLGSIRRNDRAYTCQIDRRLRLNPPAIGPRPAELAPAARAIRAQRQTLQQTVHVADQCRMQNLVRGIRVDEELDLSGQAARVLKLTGLLFCECEPPAEAAQHALRGAKRPAVRADYPLAVERDLAVVVGDHDQLAMGISPQPRQQLVAVPLVVGVRVVRVQKDNALDLGRECVNGMDVAEEERAATAMTRQHDAVGSHIPAQRRDQVADDRAGVALLAPKGRPTQLGSLHDGEHDVSRRVGFAQPANLCGHVLQVVTPVHVLRRRAAERLLDRVPVGRGEDDQQPPVGTQGRGSVDHDPDAAGEPRPADLLVKRTRRLKAGAEHLRRGGRGSQPQK